MFLESATCRQVGIVRRILLFCMKARTDKEKNFATLALKSAFQESQNFMLFIRIQT